MATIKLKIPRNKLLIETMKQYSQSAQYVLETGWENGTYFKKELHHLTYYPIREMLNLPAQLVCSSRDKACETLKALCKIKKPTKPKFKELLTIRYDARSFTFKEDFVTLASIEGRTKINIKIPEYYREYLDWQPRTADLILDKKKRLFLHITFRKNIDVQEDSNGHKLGVDVGINHVAVTSNRQFFNAKQIKSKRLKFKRVRAKLQSKGTRSAQKRLKQISGRERRFMRYWNHIVSKQIVNNCKVKTIVLENIKGIRIIKVNPHYTSQRCSRCGKLGSRSKGFFKCSHCGYSLNSDLNASYNLAKHHSMSDGVLLQDTGNQRFPRISASVTMPDIQGDDVKGTICATATELMDEISKSPTL